MEKEGTRAAKKGPRVLLSRSGRRELESIPEAPDEKTYRFCFFPLSLSRLLLFSLVPYTMSKIYLHYEGERGPDHTYIWRQAGGLPFTGRSLGDALVGFVESYNRKHGREAYDGGKLRSRRKLCVHEKYGDVRQMPLYWFKWN